MSYEPTTYCRVCGDAFDVYRVPDERVCGACVPPPESLVERGPGPHGVFTMDDFDWATRQ